MLLYSSNCVDIIEKAEAKIPCTLANNPNTNQSKGNAKTAATMAADRLSLYLHTPKRTSTR